MKKKLILIPLVAALGTGWALEPPPQPQKASDNKTQVQGPVWLGVSVGRVPPAVQAQLPDNVEQNQGLMVMDVIPGSPAERAGLKRHDVLLSYNGEKLFTPNDLVERVRSAKPGDKVTLEVVRHGKSTKLEATLKSRWSASRPPFSAPPGFHSQVWENFQSLSVAKQPDGKYKAAVEYLDGKGNKKRFEYEGTRDEIAAQVRKERDLPGPMKQQLLDALSEQMPPFPAMPEFPRMPAFNDDFFAPPPWFRQQEPRGNYWRW